MKSVAIKSILSILRSVSVCIIIVTSSKFFEFYFLGFVVYIKITNPVDIT